MSAVAEHYGCAADEWSSGRRSDGIARAVAAYLARRRFGYPMAAIAEALGYRGHGSVGTAVSRVETAGSSLCGPEFPTAKHAANCGNVARDGNRKPCNQWKGKCWKGRCIEIHFPFPHLPFFPLLLATLLVICYNYWQVRELTLVGASRWWVQDRPSADPTFSLLRRAMANLQEVERLLDHMTAGEKALLLERVVRDLGILALGIESNPAVCGGEPCIVRTRIPVWLLVQLQRLGMSEAELLRNYPGLRRRTWPMPGPTRGSITRRSSNKSSTTRRRDPWPCFTQTRIFRRVLSRFCENWAMMSAPPQKVESRVRELQNEEVLATAIREDRIVITHNRRHFIRLHSRNAEYTGIIVCTADADVISLAGRIDVELRTKSDWHGQLGRVKRPAG